MARIMSMIASMASTDPPGELIQRRMSRRGSSAAKNEMSADAVTARVVELVAEHDDALVVRAEMNSWSMGEDSGTALRGEVPGAEPIVGLD